MLQPMLQPMLTELLGQPEPILFMPLTDNLDLHRGTGSATFTRSTTGTFVDKDDGLIKVAAIDAARFESDGVLIEDAVTNLLERSEEFDNALWLKTELNVTANSATSPDGTTNADKLIPTTTNSSHNIINNSSVTNTLTYSQTWFVKADGYNFVQITGSTGFITTNWVNFNLSTGAIASSNLAGGVVASITALTNGYFRVSITAPAITTTTSGRFVLAVIDADTASRLPAFVGDGTSGVLVWGGQLENLAFPSSYIPTTTTSEPRAADNLSISAIGNFDEIQGSISLKVNLIGRQSTVQYFYSVNDGTTNNRQDMVRNGGTSSGLYFIATGGVTQMDESPGDVPLNFSFVETYINNDVKIFVDAAQVANDTTVSLPTGLTDIDIGRRVTDNDYLFGHVKDLRIYNVVLTPNQVASL